jgi:DNA-binding transcriptional ArsR family regulator
MPGERGQANVVGVALLLGLTVAALGVLTAGVGTVVQENAATADSRRVVADLDSALRPVEVTGRHRGRVSFAEGRLRTVERDLRVLNDSGVVRRVRVGGLVFTAGDRRVAYVAGAILRGRTGSGVLADPPPVTVGPEVLIVGAPRLNGIVAVAGRDVTTTLHTDVSHERSTLGADTYRLAVETAMPAPLARHFERRGANVSRRDIDDDGVPSVVARFPGTRRGYLVVHDVEVTAGG